jgi:hypothetical protein
MNEKKTVIYQLINEIIQQSVIEICEFYVNKCFEIVENAKRTHQSLQRLKRSRKKSASKTNGIQLIIKQIEIDRNELKKFIFNQYKLLEYKENESFSNNIIDSKLDKLNELKD